jgi:hypothetical protein
MHIHPHFPSDITIQSGYSVYGAHWCCGGFEPAGGPVGQYYGAPVAGVVDGMFMLILMAEVVTMRAAVAENFICLVCFCFYLLLYPLFSSLINQMIYANSVIDY